MHTRTHTNTQQSREGVDRVRAFDSRLESGLYADADGRLELVREALGKGGGEHSLITEALGWQKPEPVIHGALGPPPLRARARECVSLCECVCVCVQVCLRIHTCTHIACALFCLCAGVSVLPSVRASVGIPLPLTTLHLAADDAHLHELLDKLDHLDQSTLDWLKERRLQDQGRDF